MWLPVVGTVPTETTWGKQWRRTFTINNTRTTMERLPLHQRIAATCIVNWIPYGPWGQQGPSSHHANRRKYKTVSRKVARKLIQKVMKEDIKDFIAFTRMTPRLFKLLCDELKNEGLCDGKSFVIEEKLLHLLQVLGGARPHRLIRRLMKRSLGSISVVVRECLRCVLKLADKYVKPAKPGVPSWLANRDDLMPEFKGALGAIDGTHIPVVVKDSEKVRFANRKKGYSQNVLAACDFDGIFTFVNVGWEGSAHDARMFEVACGRGFSTPADHFYLGDAGFPECAMLLTPFRGFTYHVKEWRSTDRDYACPEELYNHKHAQARNVIERMFGVAKARWQILKRMPSYTFKRQCDLVEACFILENFIKINRTDEEIEDMAVDPRGGEDEDSQPLQPNVRYDGRGERRRAIAEALWARRRGG